MAFLSIRVPDDVRNRVKAVAAARGENLQDLIGTLLERFLEEADRKPPQLAEVVRTLRELEPRLRERGVAALWVFGSVARGEAGPGSDVDLLFQFTPDREHSLFEIQRIKDEIQAVIGHTVDLGERSTLMAKAAETAVRDMVSVF
ncbi:nucleotidyltransferase domain-containing protein [Acidisoma cellulosilytica]|uniref:Nucleotidyltransferase domain-containing protein n=1 Tax=Acidisoma cellulosilyticum TaxID=2802395 RepID=A0A963Z8D6_9PROT|nr:nucleotidyltransferase domain-containing protein [Acidisoma cellulosilyticum]MCB8883955.1 nucleotidyltransferase domain-containing protein [Acidisoma cellulosilyticum]